eukprot:9270353-Pyramimonas_sp.AAC.2
MFDRNKTPWLSRTFATAYIGVVYGAQCGLKMVANARIIPAMPPPAAGARVTFSGLDTDREPLRT